MSNQLTTVTPEIMIMAAPVKPVRFHFPGTGDLTLTISRREIAAIAEALCRLAEGERRQGIIDLALALGLEVNL